MEQGWYYLTMWDGHRSILGIGPEGTYTHTQGMVEQIADERVLEFLNE